jgi:hypothetical protein
MLVPYDDNNYDNQDLGFAEIKERYLRPYYLQGSFLFGTLTLGLRTGAMNYIFADDVSGGGRVVGGRGSDVVIGRA